MNREVDASAVASEKMAAAIYITGQPTGHLHTKVNHSELVLRKNLLDSAERSNRRCFTANHGSHFREIFLHKTVATIFVLF